MKRSQETDVVREIMLMIEPTSLRIEKHTLEPAGLTLGVPLWEGFAGQLSD